MGIGGVRMEDRFKFRIWHVPLEKMHYNDFIVTATGYMAKIYQQDDYMMKFNQEDLEFDKQCILMQCTGLKDKNGKLIYEGDILKGKKDMICSPHSSRQVDKVGVVEIPQNMFVASCRDVKNNCTLFCQNDWVKTEVIGNIYQNPELLED